MMTAQVASLGRGDLLEVSGRRVGDPGRTGEILEVLGTAERPSYLVRWEDGHESILYPGGGTTIRQHEAPVETLPVEQPPATSRLVELLQEAEVQFELLPHRRTVTALDEAHVLGVLEQTVAKTIVARDREGRRIRAVVPASRRLDLDKLALALETKDIVLVSEQELERAYPEFERGAVAPFGGPAGEAVVVDWHLGECDHVVLEAGVHDTSLRLRTDDLIAVADAMLAEIATAETA